MKAVLNVPIPSIKQGTENVARLLQQSLSMAQQAAGAAGANLSAADIELARSNIKALAFVQAVGLHGAYRYLRDFIAKQAVPIWSSGEFLDGWLETYGLKRKQAQSATGLVSCTGISGATLPAGSSVQSTAGALFTVVADATVAIDGTCSAAIVASATGSASNLAESAELTFVSPVPDIDSGMLVAAGGISGGTDIETDSEALYRLLQRLSYEPLGGSPGDYARWALQVPGITRAFGLRNPAGPTSAGVVIMADANLPHGLPTTTQQQQVFDYISDPDRGPPDELFVIIPTAVPVDVTVALNPNTSAVRAGVEEALKDLFFRESAPGGSIPVSHLREAISGVADEYDHGFTTTASVIGGKLTTAGFDEILVLGTVSFSTL